MFSSRFARVMLLGVCIAAGAWLLTRNARPAPESVAHQRAVAAYAPVTGVRLDSVGWTPATGVSQPVVVNLRDVPAGVYDPNNQFDRWKRGEIDLDEREGIVGEARMAELREAALTLEPSSQVQLATSGPLAPAAGVGFDSLDYTECCGGGGNVPPDPELAVGPNHVIAVVNVAFEIYDKAGTTLVPPTTFASFMSANSNCTGVFDPNAVYDEEAGRFVLGIDADGVGYCIAVSQTGDPTGSWNLYFFSTGSNFFDYPHAGVGRDAIYMGANLFRCTGLFCSFDESRIWAFDKWAMYNGQAASSVSFGLPVSEDTPQPLNLHGWNQGTWPSSGPHYFFTDTDFNGATYSVWSWSDPFGTNNVSLVGTVDLQAFTGVSAGMPVDVPQAGSSADLQANDFRPQDFEYRNGYGWSVQTIACNPGGGTVDCIRWAKIDPATATVVDAGVYSSDGQYRFFGDLAVNHCGDMAVGYTKSSTSMYPAIWYTGRQNGDPAGTLQAEAELKAGELTYTAFDSPPHRWGDYTEMTVDPNGDMFWYLGEYSKDTGTTDGRWGTFVGSFSFSCDTGGTDPTPTPTPTATPSSGSTLHVGDLDGSGTNDGNRWSATVTILVVDSNNNPVSNATVDGNWSNGASGSSSCTTDASGLCSVSIGGLRKNVSSVTFTVANVSHGSLAYDAGANTDPDGDSDGTTITVLKP